MFSRLPILHVLILAFFISCGNDSPTDPPDDNGGSEDKAVYFDLPGGVKMAFIWIDPGTFMMGAPQDEWLSEYLEHPQHQVTLTKGFYLGQFEVTQAQWLRIMGSLPELPDTHVDALNPVVNITWEQSQEFVRTLNQAVGKDLYRLPTEAEWEYACRAGTTTAFSFGDWGYNIPTMNEHMWYGNISNSHPHRVGEKLPNPWFLYDMHGNADEWVQDWGAVYPEEPQVDPTGPGQPPEGETYAHIHRGGNYMAFDHQCRSASRLTVNVPSNTGVRIVRKR